jgi:hypothetical protein
MRLEGPLKIARVLRELRSAMPTYVPPLLGRVTYDNDRGLYVFQVGVSTILQAVNIYPEHIHTQPADWFWDFTLNRFMQTIQDPVYSEMVLSNHPTIPCILIDDSTTTHAPMMN